MAQLTTVLTAEEQLSLTEAQAALDARKQALAAAKPWYMRPTTWLIAGGVAAAIGLYAWSRR